MCKALIFGCISAVLLMTAAYGAPLMAEAHEAPLSTAEKDRLLHALIADLNTLNVFKVDHLNFYTANDKQDCVKKTLECYGKELGVLEYEVDETELVTLRNIIKNLQCLTTRMQTRIPEGSRCMQCEAHGKEKFPAFRQELLSILQSMKKEIS